MSANSVFLLVLVVFIVTLIALLIASVKWGLKWAKVAEIGYAKAFGIYLLIWLTIAVVAIASGIIIAASGIRISKILVDAAGFVLQFFAACFVIAMMYRVRLWRAALAILPYFAVTIGMVAFSLGVLRPLFYEAFSIPTNGMAPTILGVHLEAPCPDCDSPAYGAPFVNGPPIPPDGLPMICSKELKTVRVVDPPKTLHEGDRILISKQLAPRRWDLIVFRWPPDPSNHYVMRLVGLTGEKLEIKDGAIWINGERIEPPESIRGIHYSPTIEWGGQVHFGPGSDPVTLGPDEYFVLGDFLDQSADSRFWERGAPGHQPFAVPTSHLIGVVINVYWPPSRWTSFR
jgi:signal peptidase I